MISERGPIGTPMATIGNRWDLIFIPSGPEAWWGGLQNSEDEAQQGSPQEAKKYRIASGVLHFHIVAPLTSPKTNFATLRSSVRFWKAY